MTKNQSPIGTDGVTALPATNANPPDWATFKEELLCPLCEYNLRGIFEPRCPECGYRFTWHELLDAKENQHPYLFEQQDRRRFSAFWKTAIGGLRPGKFWRQLKPGQKSHPRQVWFYFALVMLVALAGERCAMLAPDGKGRALWGRYYYQIIEAGGYCFFATIFWPLATIASLMIFRISMKMVRLRPEHAIRCVLYSADCLLWLGLFLLIWSASLVLIDFTPKTVWRFDAPDLFPVITLCMLPIFIYRLCRAYALYMRLDWPIATVLASQVIVLLALVVIMVNVKYKPWVFRP